MPCTTAGVNTHTRERQGREENTAQRDSHAEGRGTKRTVHFALFLLLYSRDEENS